MSVFTRISQFALFLALSEPAYGILLPVNPFVPVGNPKSGIQQLQIAAAEYESIKDKNELTIPGFVRGSGATIDLALQRMNPFAPDAKVVAATFNGEHEIGLPDIQFFSGAVIGDPSSRVFLALSPHGTSGSITAFGETSIISSGPGGRMQTVIYETSSSAAHSINFDSPLCRGGLTPPGQVPQEPVGEISLPQSSVCRNYRLALDCDSEFTANLFGGNQTNATAYAATMVAGMTAIYQRDVNVSFQIGYLRLWIDPDPYTMAGAGDQLGEFRDYWVNNMGAVSRTMAHLLSGRGLGGGVAWVSQVCAAYSYATSANLGGYFPYPLVNNSHQNWDIMVFAHETGHNMGSGHTHDINSYNPIIDGCGNGDCTNAFQGTIMSYCHGCAGGMSNIRTELGPRVSAAIRSYLDSQPLCGTSPIIIFNSQPRNRTVCRNGSVTFNVVVSGTPPLTYQWKLNGVNIPGATSSSFTESQANSLTAGSYVCAVSSTCRTVDSNPGILTVCGANFNCDLLVDFFDYLDFVDAFSSLDPTADFNDDSTIDFFDYLDFVDAYSVGC